MSHRIGFSTVLLLLALGLSSCGGSGASTSPPPPNPTLTGVVVTSPSSSVALGSTLSLTATATYSDGSSKDVTSQAAWTSSNTADATVSTAGVVSPLAVVASVTITAAFGGKSGQTVLAVTTAVGPTLTGVVVTSPSSSVTVGSTLALTGTATYSDGTSKDVTSQASWTSSNTADATVSASGVVSALAVVASVTITAAFGALSGQTVLAVTAAVGPTLTGVVVTSPSSSVTVGSTLSLTATATYSDGTSQNVTSQTAWTSSNTADATVSTSGVVSALNVVASVTITGAFDGQSGQTLLAITASGSPTAVPSSLFGMSAHEGVVVLGGDPWPTMPIFGLRLWDADTGWGQINTAKGVYDWTILDEWIAAVGTHNDQLIYTFGDTPTWASSNPGDTSCDYGPGFCWPPNDLNSDGTGTDQHWIDFVTAIAQHAPSITYWEMWNTPHDTFQWNGTDAQLVRMAQDARTYIQKYIPTAKIISPANGQLNYTYPGANCTMADKMGGYLAAGLGKYIDVVALHTYYTTVQENIVGVVQCYQSIMATYNVKSLPLWSTEGAWPTNSELPGAKDQAGFLARLYLLLWSNGVVRHYWYAWNDANTGTLEVNGITNSVGTAYAQVESWMSGRTMSTPCSKNSSGIWTCGFTGSSGYQSQAVWHPGSNKSYTAPSKYINYLDLSGKKHTIAKGATVTVGVEPILLQNQ